MHKLPYRSIKSLYALALAEGEGVGTAYEYFAKRLAMSRWLPAAWRPAACWSPVCRRSMVLALISGCWRRSGARR